MYYLFLPSVKLLIKNPLVSKIIKGYDNPKNPFQKLVESKNLDEEKERKLLNTLRKINTYKVQKTIKSKVNEILNLTDFMVLITLPKLQKEKLTIIIVTFYYESIAYLIHSYLFYKLIH